MKGEIINRVAQSPIKLFDLEDYYVTGTRTELDISKWLYEGIVLKEKEFRNFIIRQDWTIYQNHHIALYCSTEAIVPIWAFMLVTSALDSFAKTVFLGNIEQLEVHLYRQALDALSLDPFLDKPVIIKGCSNKFIPEDAYVLAISKLQKVARKIMYGEACSAVPLFKKT